MNNPPEIELMINKFGKVSIFSFAVYSDMTDEDLFILTKGLYVAIKIYSNVVLVDDFEKHITVIETQEDSEMASLFGRVANTNLNIALAGSFQDDSNYISDLLKEGMDYMQVENEFIGFFEVESNV